MNEELMIIDDPQDDDRDSSPAQRQVLLKWWNRLMKIRRTETGARLIVVQAIRKISVVEEIMGRK